MDDVQETHVVSPGPVIQETQAGVDNLDMIVWGADGELATGGAGLRLIDLGGHKVYVDDASSDPNRFAKVLGLNIRGAFGIEIGANILDVFKVFGNTLRFHDLIFGTRVKDIQDENFAAFLPSYNSIFEFMEWSDILCDEGQCGKILYEARMQAFKTHLSPEEFFRMYPRTGCPYIHCWNDEKDDVESTCTLCEGYARERSRSPRGKDPEFSCLSCGAFLGMHNPRQFCGKTHCLEI